MPTKTGYAQAVVVYRVNAKGEAVGVDGLPISKTGAKQAIAVLAGRTNPDPSKYAIQMFYGPEATIDGTPTVALSDDCAVGYMLLSNNRLVFFADGPPQTTILTASDPWEVASIPAGLVTISPMSGPRDANVITVTRTVVMGQGDVIFRNTITGLTVALHVICADTDVWILEGGTWNALGFWHSDGIWKSV